MSKTKAERNQQVVTLVADLRGELEDHSDNQTITVKQLTKFLDLCLRPVSTKRNPYPFTNGEFGVAMHKSRGKRK